MKRQANALTAVLENWQDVENAIDIYANSAGSALRENEIYLNSWVAKSKAVSAAWNEFVNTFLDSDWIKGFLDKVQKLLSFLTDINAAVPILAGLISGLLTSAFLKGTFTIKGFNAALIKTNILSAGIPLIIGSLVTLVGGLASWATSAFNTAKQIENLTEKIEEQQQAIDDLNAEEKEVTDLYKKYNALMSKSNAYGLTAHEKENLLKISNDLVETYGLEADGIDSITGAYIVGTNAINGYIDAMRTERREVQESQTDTRNDRIKTNTKALQDLYNEVENSVEDEGYFYINGNYAQLEKTSKKLLKEIGIDDKKPWYSFNDSYYNELLDKNAHLVFQNYEKIINSNILDDEEKKLFESWFKAYKNEFTKNANEITKYANDIFKDVLTNIRVESGGMLDAEGENFLVKVISPYLSGIDWVNFDKKKFQEDIQNFVADNKDFIDNVVKNDAEINKKISSENVSIDDYKDYIENEFNKANLVARMIGGEIGEAKGKEMINNLANNFGATMANISKILGDSSALFDVFTTNFLRLEREFVNGETSFNEYIDEINKSLDNLDIEKTFGSNTNAIGSFFNSMTDKGKKMIENLAADFKAGEKSISDYIGEIDTIGIYFVNLGEKAASAMGENSDTAKSIKKTSGELQSLLDNLKNLQDVVGETSVSFDDFQKKPVSSIESLVNKLLDLGFTIEDLGGKAGDSAKDVAESLKTETSSFAKMQESLADKTRMSLARIGQAIGKILSGVADYVKNFKVEFDVDLNLFDGDGIGISPKITNTGESSISDEDKKKYADNIAGIKRRDNGNINTEGLTDGEIRELIQKRKDAMSHSDLEVYMGNLLSEGITSNFWNSIISNNDDITNDTTNDEQNSKSSFDNNYYSILNAWIEENKKEINKLKKEREALNRQFENALDTGNKEQAEILRAKLAKNAKLQKDILHKQNEAYRITQKDLMQSLYQYAPSLLGKSWDEISEVDLVNIENTLNKAVETAQDDNSENQAKYNLNQFQGIVEDLKSLNDTINENSEAWWEADENAKSYWQSQIDFQDDYSNNWIDNQKSFDKLSEEEELAAYDRMINNNKEFQKQILNDISLSEESKLALIAETNDKIVDIEKNVYELRKDLFDKANDFASSYKDSQKTLLQSYYDVTNSIAEAQHEINKELETSKTMYEYLDEETRKLLFNQEDYNTLSEELYDIQYKADKLQRQYRHALENSTLSTIEEITSNYEMQYETLMKSYEIAKADLEIAKKKAQLNNVLNERNVRMFINGQWQWVANTEDVANAKSELADAEYAKRVEEAGLVQQKSINNLTKQQNELTTVINKFENGVIGLDEAVAMAKRAIGSLPNALSSMYSKSSSGSSKLYNGSSSGRILQVQSDGKAPSWAKTGDIIRTAGGDYLITGGSNGNYTSQKIDNEYATGTRFTQGGLTALGEKRDEVFIDNNGHLIPINQPTIGNFGAGGIVFNQDQMDFTRKIWDWSNTGIIPNKGLINKSIPQTIEKTIDNRIIINGMTVDSGSSDGQLLINALKRYVGNH